MANAHCATCGQNIVFTSDEPAEISDCTTCKTRVKRTAEMPGLAFVAPDVEQTSRTSIPKADSEEPKREGFGKPVTNRIARANRQEREEAEAGVMEILLSSIKELQESVRGLKRSQVELLRTQQILLEKLAPGSSQEIAAAQSSPFVVAEKKASSEADFCTVEESETQRSTKKAVPLEKDAIGSPFQIINKFSSDSKGEASPQSEVKAESVGGDTIAATSGSQLSSEENPFDAPLESPVVEEPAKASSPKTIKKKESPKKL